MQSVNYTCPLQFFGDRDKGLQYLVDCTKLYPKGHVVYLCPIFGVLFVHHPDTARVFFGSGEQCMSVRVYVPYVVHGYGTHWMSLPLHCC